MLFLVTKYPRTVEVIVNLLNLNIVNFKAAGKAQLKMIKYDFDYQLFNGLVMDGKINLELNVATHGKKMVMSFTPKSLPMVSTELRITGWTVKAHLMSSYVTPNVPIICNDKETCSMILDVQYEVDFATRILNIL